MFYCIDQPCTHLFLLGCLKLNLFLLLDQLTNADVGAYLFLAFSDLTCHLEDTGIGVFWLRFST